MKDLENLKLTVYDVTNSSNLSTDIVTKHLDGSDKAFLPEFDETVVGVLRFGLAAITLLMLTSIFGSGPIVFIAAVAVSIAFFGALQSDNETIAGYSSLAGAGLLMWSCISYVQTGGLGKLLLLTMFSALAGHFIIKYSIQLVLTNRKNEIGDHSVKLLGNVRKYNGIIDALILSKRLDQLEKHPAQTKQWNHVDAMMNKLRSYLHTSLIVSKSLREGTRLSEPITEILTDVSDMNYDEDLERVSHSGGVLRQALAMMKELESDLHGNIRGTI